MLHRVLVDLERWASRRSLTMGGSDAMTEVRLVRSESC
jgi:hypothetical protein